MLTEKICYVTIFFERGEKEKTGKPQDLPVEHKTLTL